MIGAPVKPAHRFELAHGDVCIELGLGHVGDGGMAQRLALVTEVLARRIETLREKRQEVSGLNSNLNELQTRHEGALALGASAADGSAEQIGSSSAAAAKLCRAVIVCVLPVPVSPKAMTVARV